MADITMIKGEGKTIQFTLTRNNAVIDLSGATFSFVVKASYDATTYLIEKADASFDKTNAIVGVVSVTITATDSDITAGNYIAELKTIITANTDVDKSTVLTFELLRSVHN